MATRNAIVLMALVFVFALVLPVSAATVTFASGDGSATSNTGSVYTINPHPYWDNLSGALWVSSYQNTGYGQGVFLPNSPGLGSPTMVFTETFNLPYAVNSGWLIVGADDTMAVWLNGILLKQANFVLDDVCASGPIACQPGEFLTLNLAGVLSQGTNVLRMDIYQLGGDVSGGIFKAEMTSTVPEPATYAMLGLGLAAIGLISRRKKSGQD